MSISDEKPKFVIGMLVHDKPGVMMKITGMFARRGYNIESITVGKSEREGFSRITIVSEGDEKVLEQIIKQLNKLIDVVKVQHLNQETTNLREFALIKVSAKDNAARQEILTLVNIYRGKIIDVTSKTMTIELIGQQAKIESFIQLIGDITRIKEIVRSGMVALLKGEDSISLE